MPELLDISLQLNSCREVAMRSRVTMTGRKVPLEVLWERWGDCQGSLKGSGPLVIASHGHTDLLPFQVNSYRSGSAVAQQHSLISFYRHLCAYWCTVCMRKEKLRSWCLLCGFAFHTWVRRRLNSLPHQHLDSGLWVGLTHRLLLGDVFIWHWLESWDGFEGWREEGKAIQDHKKKWIKIKNYAEH